MTSKFAISRKRVSGGFLRLAGGLAAGFAAGVAGLAGVWGGVAGGVAGGFGGWACATGAMPRPRATAAARMLRAEALSKVVLSQLTPTAFHAWVTAVSTAPEVP